jgi:protein involved in polysaccharide export with SLBB domain
VSLGPKQRAALSLLAIACLLPACVTTDDARVQQLLNQRGFGARYVGDTNTQYYLGIGDQFTVTDDQHPEFNDIFRVRPDGVIDAKNIGEIFVAGLSIPDAEETLTRRYREFNTTAQIDVTLVASVSKWYYVSGEVTVPGRKPFEGDTSLFKAVFDAVPTLLSDDDGITLIRADPYHPLVVVFDYDDMLEGGWSLANAEVRENDIIFVPPNTFGYITNFMIQLFSPIAVISQAVFGVNGAIFAVQTFGDTNRYGRGFGNRRGFGYVVPATSQGFELHLAPLDPSMLGDG